MRFSSPAYLAVLDDAPAKTRLRISSACCARMREHAESGYPLEVCGLLVGNMDRQGWRIAQIRPVENLNRERAADRFQLDPAAYQAIDRELRGTGLEIVGVYHSHPDCPARPSPTDLDSAWEGFAYPIVSTRNGSATNILCWQLNDKGERFRAVDIEIVA